MLMEEVQIEIVKNTQMSCIKNLIKIHNELEETMYYPIQSSRMTH